MSEVGPKLYANKHKKAQLKQVHELKQVDAAARSYTMGTPPPQPPPPPKESFARLYKFLWPLLLTVNLAFGGPIPFQFGHLQMFNRFHDIISGHHFEPSTFPFPQFIQLRASNSSLPDPKFPFRLHLSHEASTVLNPSVILLDLDPGSARQPRPRNRDPATLDSSPLSNLRQSDVTSILDLRRSRPRPRLGPATSTPARPRNPDPGSAPQPRPRLDPATLAL
ncbi:formin-like protein 20 isoform X2 [Punica granatum]|uniref:Formin-like protein 20 isoform X2 n=1 Tax=Punica granatum TaxID=22663 RepID=A0A6P8CZU0_PUNGR|nr:formin-like protein 20 isoform X2 [Punica granatum]